VQRIDGTGGGGQQLAGEDPRGPTMDDGQPQGARRAGQEGDALFSSRLIGSDPALCQRGTGIALSETTVPTPMNV
jgi:hypothetical protein